MSDAKAEARRAARTAYRHKMSEQRPHDPYIILGSEKTGWIDAAIDAYEAALEKAGLVLVPREPTEAMLGAVAHLRVEAKSHPMHLTGGFADVYRAMIAAAEPK